MNNSNNNITSNNNSYSITTYKYGLIWIWSAALLLLLIPIVICIHYDSWPGITPVLKGLLGVAPIFWTVGLIEVFTYVPMLGTGGSFLGFVTGNVTALKVPSALNAMESMKVKPGTNEGEIISTIAIATSSIVTTIIIALGVLLFAQLEPLLNADLLKPAFDNILPSLMGGLAVVYVSKNWKISVAPLLFMVILFILVPSLASSVGILVPVGAIIAIVSARIMYKKGVL